MKIATGTLVMAMDGSKAHLFKNTGDTQKPLLEPISSHQAANPRSSEQGTDRPGRSFSSGSPRRSAMGETDLHDLAETDFVREASQLLDKAQQEHDRGVILLAAPTVLGEFRKCCPERLRPSILAEIGKDVVNHAPDKIVSIIDAVDG